MIETSEKVIGKVNVMLAECEGFQLAYKRKGERGYWALRPHKFEYRRPGYGKPYLLRMPGDLAVKPKFIVVTDEEHAMLVEDIHLTENAKNLLLRLIVEV